MHREVSGASLPACGIYYRILVDHGVQVNDIKSMNIIIGTLYITS